MSRVTSLPIQVSQQDLSSHRKSLLDRFNALLLAWQAGDRASLAELLVSNVQLVSSAHGKWPGPTAMERLVSDTTEKSLSLESFNEFAAATSSSGTLGAYVIGTLSQHALALATFGATITAEAEQHSSGWRFTHLRLQVLWVQGDKGLVRNWRLPTDEVWSPGDPAPAMVSEMDAPWRVVPHRVLPFDINEQLAEAFYRYAWSMDHADFDLMRSCLTDDIAGEFTPLGYLMGIRHVIGALKAFRQRWPWMQHLGRVVHVEGSSSGQEATLIVGRIVPGQPRYSQGHEVFGAHYNLRMVKPDGQWLIRRFEYRPGTVLANHLGQDKGTAPMIEKV